MRALRRRLCVWSLIALGSVGDAAFALPHWTPKPAGPTTVYTPRVRHFIVVDPVAAPAAALMPTPVAKSIPVAPAPADRFSAPAAAAAPGEAAAPAISAPLSPPRKGERLKKALSPVQTQNIFWQERVEPVTAYPWGWFGARRHTSNIGHRRYYGGQYDSSLLRGD